MKSRNYDNQNADGADSRSRRPPDFNVFEISEGRAITSRFLAAMKNKKRNGENIDGDRELKKLIKYARRYARCEEHLETLISFSVYIIPILITLPVIYLAADPIAQTTYRVMLDTLTSGYDTSDLALNPHDVFNLLYALGLESFGMLWLFIAHILDTTKNLSRFMRRVINSDREHQDNLMKMEEWLRENTSDDYHRRAILPS